MSLHLFLRKAPQRSVALVTDRDALIFRHSPSSSAINSPNNVPNVSKCMVEFSTIQSVDLTDYRVLRNTGVHGTLGLINVNTDLFLCVITGAVKVATVRPNETVKRILEVEFYCLNGDEYDLDFPNNIDLYSVDSYVTNGYDHGYKDEGRDPSFEHPCSDLKRMLSSGTFYYSGDFDLTNRLQDRASEQSAFDVDSLDDGFLWNSYMIDPLIQFRSRLADDKKEVLDQSRILTSAIRGFVSTVTIPAPSSPLKNLKTNLASNLTVISRLSCKRAGTRFNSRGIDDDGNAANFVETETVFYHPSSLCFSYAQIRGSVPIFWEQAPGLIPGQQKIQITRSPEATQPAFDKHFEALEVDYGTVHILNLLSGSKPGEAELTARYSHHLQQTPLNQVVGNGGSSENRFLETQFDFHAETRGSGGYEAASIVRRLIQQRADGFAYFLSENASLVPEKTVYARLSQNVGTVVILQQEGVFRTNCLDCLDRTNLIQTIISQMALENFFSQQSEHPSVDFWTKHSTLWADNGDALSKIYAGTGALKSSFTRHGKMSLAGALADARKSATRIYINNFADKGRQNTIDMLLGRLMDQAPVHLYDPVADYVNTELKKRVKDYTKPDSVHIWVGTFNLNGRSGGVKENLSAWLWPEINQQQQRPGIVAVGFQEIVELSPQQIMSTDPIRRQAWETAVKRSLNDSARKDNAEEYVLLRSGQLVGAALMIFIQVSLLGKVKNVEGGVKKTGMSGIAGNKGAVAIRMDYASTRLCFVTAHLAAGFANYEERNRDYRTISQGLRFQRNRSIEDHDAIIWAGDFNYRIGLSDEKTRQLINAEDLETLYHNDQLNLQMVAGHAFPFYSESRITFLPTYKYNNGTDDYDTSEKVRIPAWCDRVLRKGEALKQINYATAPLRFSDHRPVYATFICAINDIDESKKAALSREIYAKRRLDVGDTTANARHRNDDDEDLIGYDSIAPELPPASSDRRKWWLDNGQPSRSSLKQPGTDYMMNPNRPSNPFTPTSELDWVQRSESQLKPLESPIDKQERGATVDSRKPPLPPEPRRQISSSTYGSGKMQTVALNSQPRTFSQSSTKSASSNNVSRKPAPPIPKKPDELRRSSNGKSASEPQAPTSAPTSRRSSTSQRNEASQMKHRDPSRPQGQASSDHSPKSPSTSGQRHSEGPPLPLRRNAARMTSQSNLMDEDDEGAKTIPPLQPTRRP